jgi:hypothetical protein
MVNGSLRVLRLLPPLKLVAMIDIAEITLFCNLQSRARTHAVTVLVIGLCELLGNSTTLLIEPPGPLVQASKNALNLLY